MKNETYLGLFDEIYKEAEAIQIGLDDRNKKGRLLAPNGQESRLQNELHWKIVRTPSFKKWFGDWMRDPIHSSKVVDPKTGEPLLVYHSTLEEIGMEGLQPQESFPDGKEKGEWNKGTIYFSSQPQIAKYFADFRYSSDIESMALSGELYEEGGIQKEIDTQKERYFSCFLNMKKPLVVRNHQDVQNVFVTDDRKKSADFIGHKASKEVLLVQGREDMIAKGYDGVIQKHGDLQFEIPVDRPKKKDVSLYGDHIPLDGDQYIAFTAQEVCIVPSDKSLKGKIDIEARLDQVRLPYLTMKETMQHEYRSALHKETLLSSITYRVKEIDFLTEKISNLLLDTAYADSYSELRRIQKNLVKYRNHNVAFVAFYKKDKQKIKECIDASEWKKEQLEELYNKLDSKK